MKLFKNKKTRGAISIFLVMILLPTMLFSAVLIDGSRMASARAMTQEAADLAAASALAGYNQKLKDEFGLFAVKDPDKLESVYKESLAATLLASGLSEDEAYSEKLWGIMKSAVGAGNPYQDKKFLNLYDFAVDSCKVEPKYPLAEKDVLQNQMVEYAKYRGIYIMADRLGILTGLGSPKHEAEQAKEATEVMEKKMDVDESNGAADKDVAQLMRCISRLNQEVRSVSTMKEAYLAQLPAYMEKVKLENTDIEGDIDSNAVNDYETIAAAIPSALPASTIWAQAVLDQAQATKSSIQSAIARLEQFQKEQSGKAQNNEAIQELINDAGEDIAYYRDTCLVRVEALLEDGTLKKLAADTELGQRMGDTIEKIEKAVEKYAEELEEQARENQNENPGGDSENSESSEPEEILEYYYYYLNLSGKDESAQTVISGGTNAGKYYRPAVTEVIRYFEGQTWNDTNPAESRNKDSENEGKIDEKVAAKQSEGEDENQKPDYGSARKEVKSEDYKVRPSKNYTSIAMEENNGGFWNTSGSLSGTKKALNGGNSMFLQVAETARDEVLSLSYMYGTFKTRLTGNDKLTGKKMSDTEKNNDYMPKWRYAHEEGEIDMRFEPKKERKTALRSEIEYLICGNRTDAANETAVYAFIFSERLANNIYAMYREKQTIKPSCEAAAYLASWATQFVVPEQVFFWIFLTAWATAETRLEMHYLIDCGYKIPAYKTKDNILLKDIPTGEGLVSNYGDVKKGLFVTYEDYLLVMLLLQGSEKRIMRTADLIEFNMKENGQSDFAMSKAYTYLSAESQMSIRYLFGSTDPFQTAYENNGVTGRMKFTNKIYQGY